MSFLPFAVESKIQVSQGAVLESSIRSDSNSVWRLCLGRWLFEASGQAHFMRFGSQFTCATRPLRLCLGSDTLDRFWGSIHFGRTGVAISSNGICCVARSGEQYDAAVHIGRQQISLSLGSLMSAGPFTLKGLLMLPQLIFSCSTVISISESFRAIFSFGRTEHSPYYMSYGIARGSRSAGLVHSWSFDMGWRTGISISI